MPHQVEGEGSTRSLNRKVDEAVEMGLVKTSAS